jgi:hypothetical protein
MRRHASATRANAPPLIIVFAPTKAASLAAIGEAAMKAVATVGRCQRPGCGRRAIIPGQLVRIDGEFFTADPERRVESAYRLYCSRCAIGICQAINWLTQKPNRNLPAD